MTRLSTNHLVYIDSVGINTRVYSFDSGLKKLDEPVMPKEASTVMFQGVTSGAPEPFILGGMLLSRKIIVHETIEYNAALACGKFRISLYTIFNYSFINNITVSNPCP